MTKLLLISMLMVASGSILADEYESPESLLMAMQELQQTDCDLRCHIKLADMYTDKFLNAQREVVLAAMEPHEARAEITQSFFGRQIDLAALKRMSPQEFFAHQTHRHGRSAPAEFLMKDLTIVQSSAEPSGEVLVTVMLSGMAADPDYAEESLFRFVRTEAGWKVDGQF